MNKFNPTIDKYTGLAVLGSDESKTFKALMNQVFESGDKEQMRILGGEVTVVFDMMVAYAEWAQWLLGARTIDLGDQIKVIKDRYDVNAYQVSVDGRPYITRAGYTTDNFAWNRYQVGFELHWRDAKLAGYDMLARKVKLAADQMARKRDGLIQTTVDAAVSGLSGHEPTVGSTLTKAAIDSVIKTATQNGIELQRAVVNSGTILDMRGFSWPFQMPENEARQLLTKGFIGEYGGLLWQMNHSVPTDKVYFAADPETVGLSVQHGATDARQDINVYEGTNVYIYEEERGAYVGNPYRVYVLTIT